MNDRIGPESIAEALAMIAGTEEAFTVANRLAWASHHPFFNAWWNAKATIEQTQDNLGIRLGDAA